MTEDELTKLTEGIKELSSGGPPPSVCKHCGAEIRWDPFILKWETDIADEDIDFDKGWHCAKDPNSRRWRQHEQEDGKL